MNLINNYTKETKNKVIVILPGNIIGLGKTYLGMQLHKYFQNYPDKAMYF